MLIRKAKKDDTDTIVAIIAPYVDQVITNDEGRSRFKSEAIQTIFDREDIHYFVGEIDQQIVGIVAYMEPSHLMHFFIKKTHLKLGLGRQLWDFIEEKIKNENIDIEKITVNSSFYAQDIYEKFGFIVSGDAAEKWGIRFIPMTKYYALPSEK
ncbi:GNAT family N-acetyltransferase [Acinetobacter baumannii]|nr:GNAT family N-acetyltransferase [Acinetobacter baumannii]HAV4461973.1 GNAT family N-acetyltransferase [Acinetobacter baumannii]